MLALPWLLEPDPPPPSIHNDTPATKTLQFTPSDTALPTPQHRIATQQMPITAQLNRSSANWSGVTLKTGVKRSGMKITWNQFNRQITSHIPNIPPFSFAVHPSAYGRTKRDATQSASRAYQRRNTSHADISPTSFRRKSCLVVMEVVPIHEQSRIYIHFLFLFLRRFEWSLILSSALKLLNCFRGPLVRMVD